MIYFSNEMFSLVKNGVYSSKHWNKESYKDCSFAAMVASTVSRKQIHCTCNLFFKFTFLFEFLLKFAGNCENCVESTFYRLF